MAEAYGEPGEKKTVISNLSGAFAGEAMHPGDVAAFHGVGAAVVWRGAEKWHALHGVQRWLLAWRARSRADPPANAGSRGHLILEYRLAHLGLPHPSARQSSPFRPLAGRSARWTGRKVLSKPIPTSPGPIQWPVSVPTPPRRPTCARPLR